MPIQTIWVEPELFLEHGGVQVFHTYKDDDMDQGTNHYYFTLNSGCGVEERACDDEPCQHGFDVRQLPTWHLPEPPPFCVGENDTLANQAAWQRYWEQERTAIKAAVVAAIDGGKLPLKATMPDQAMAPKALIRSIA